ncbi:MAG TPA: GTPase Era [Bryobacteraceae bacterium]|nr:GTPase Era [Bryobacteraceae bacterium]
MTEPSAFRSGFVSILGRPNAGKSTLLNAVVGAKIAIVADKPQTTRTSIQGVLTLPEAQIVFLDTPGIHKTDSLINKRMMETVRAALDERDLLLLLVDASRKFTVEDEHAVSLVKRSDTPVILVLNKIDLCREKGVILPLIERYKSLYEFADYIPVSALAGDGLEVLRKEIVARLPEGPKYFPDDHVTDQPERFMAAELVREKVLRLTRQEVPHAVAVQVEGWEETEKLTRIYATIHVEREGQKGILIGTRGEMLKRIGTLAREEMERLFGCKVFLDLRVKVLAEWRQKPAFLDLLDWRTMAGKR